MSEGWEAMSNSGRLGGYEHIATRWGREEVKNRQGRGEVVLIGKICKKVINNCG